MLRNPSRVGRLMMMTIALMSAGACADVNQPIPSDLVDPATVTDSAGAAGMYAMAHLAFQQALVDHIVATGLFTDELRAGEIFNADGKLSPAGMLDARTGSEDLSGSVYTDWHAVRRYSAQAIGALARYDAPHAANRRGMAYVYAGYAEIFLADLYCSGIPLSTFDFGKDITYRAGDSTGGVYRHAVALFDTAMSLAPDSDAVMDFARVGKGRALLAIGDYAGATAVVHDVATDFNTIESIMQCTVLSDCASGIQSTEPARLGLIAKGTVADHEGVHGFPYRSQNDPRTAAIASGTFVSGIQRYIAAKYPSDQPAAVVVASGVEARLIDAEVALRNGQISTWYDILRALRTTGVVTRIDTTFVDPGQTVVQSIDTVWDAGTGGVAGIRPLPDLEPGTGLSGSAATDARVDLLFQERASWLFLTGHRQGDLRRLIRVYKRSKSRIYPTGEYMGRTLYGNAADLLIPDAERANPKFAGCLSRD